jgi:tRNA-dihydrouridine synthase
MTTIWQQLPKPFFVLAPMEDVTDTVFRQIVARTGAPDLFFTEFVYVEGLVTRGRHATSRRFIHTPVEQPLIAQIWGREPQNFYRVARELATGEFGPFAGIDLNMGCPERKIVRRGECAGLIDRPTRAVEIIKATQEGAGNLPVSVKTRCGTREWITEEWAATLLAQDLDALTIHGRIAAEKSNFPARWEEIAKVVALRDRLGKTTPIIGNGDVSSHADGLAKAAQYGVDGLMVGRGIFRNLWFFDPTVDPATVPLHERLALLIDHVRGWQHHWTGEKNFEATKKFYKAYFYEVEGMADLQRELMLLRAPEETLARLEIAYEQARQPLVARG